MCDAEACRYAGSKRIAKVIALLPNARDRHRTKSFQVPGMHLLWPDAQQRAGGAGSSWSPKMTICRSGEALVLRFTSDRSHTLMGE